MLAVLDAASTREHGTSTARSILLLVGTFRAVNPTAAIVLFAGAEEVSACTTAAASTTGVIVVNLVHALPGSTDKNIDTSSAKEQRPTLQLPGWSAVAAIVFGFLDSRQGQYRNVLWLSGSAIFQKDPFAAIPLPPRAGTVPRKEAPGRNSDGNGRNSSAAGGRVFHALDFGLSVFLTDTYPSYLTSIDPNVALLLGWMGICQNHDESLLKDAENFYSAKGTTDLRPVRGPTTFRGPGLVNSAAFMGSAKVIEITLAEVVHAHTREPKYWPVCG